MWAYVTLKLSVDAWGAGVHVHARHMQRVRAFLDGPEVLYRFCRGTKKQENPCVEGHSKGQGGRVRG